VNANDMSHSAHMRKNLPRGGNILFEDFHVEWRTHKALYPWFNCHDGVVNIIFGIRKPVPDSGGRF